MNLTKVRLLSFCHVYSLFSQLFCHEQSRLNFLINAAKNLGGTYVQKEEIFQQLDVIFFMMPLLPATKHTINDSVLKKLKKGVIIINTSRCGLIDTNALISGIQSGRIGGAGIDVYLNEGNYFFLDHSSKNIEDETLLSLLGNNKIVMTAHQAFAREAIGNILSTTLDNFQLWFWNER